jgi:D-alanyl-D-alanine carboxypeptidase/D-alanyl-D-alanine-endopeptidase (penicillin-binding protein 4)
VRRRVLLSLLAPALAGVALGVPPATSAAPGTVVERVRGAVRTKSHSSFQHSVAVWDAATGDRLFADDPGVLRRTASAMKLATTGAALLALGADHEMYLEIRAAARPEGGLLGGDLVVEGTGDPGLSEHLAEGGAAAALAALARAVREAGVERVAGDLVLDTSAFPGPARHPGWERRPDQYDWYMAPVTALTVNDGCIDLQALPGAGAGEPARLSIEPLGARPPLVNAVRTTTQKSKHLFRLLAPDEEGRIRVVGGVLTGSRGVGASVACVDPPQLLGDTLAHALKEQGVRIAGSTRILRDASAGRWPRSRDRRGVVLARHATPLIDVVGVANRRSQNLHSELILRNLGLHAERDASFEGGCRAVRRILELDAAEFVQEDGSGLSRGNRATVGALGDVLLRMYRSEHRIAFMSSLAKGGDPSGTLRRRFREKRFEGRVLAKTGTLKDTKALAGYVRAESGRIFVFAILCEGSKSRATKLQDAVVSALVGG